MQSILSPRKHGMVDNVLGSILHLQGKSSVQKYLTVQTPLMPVSVEQHLWMSYVRMYAQLYLSCVMCYRLPDASCSSEDADPWTIILTTFEGALELCDFLFPPFTLCSYFPVLL